MLPLIIKPNNNYLTMSKNKDPPQTAFHSLTPVNTIPPNANAAAVSAANFLQDMRADSCSNAPVLAKMMPNFIEHVTSTKNAIVTFLPMSRIAAVNDMAGGCMKNHINKLMF